MHEVDVVVIGGGAAGLMTARVAGQRGRRVCVLEHNTKVGEKIRISGGGRCNFTNLYADAENYLSENPHFCKSALSRYSVYDFIGLVERYGIAYHEKTLGQLFCDGSSTQIIKMLVQECRDAGVTIHTGCEVESVRATADATEVSSSQSAVDARFVVKTSMGRWRCTSVVIASGGLAIPKMGATGFGLRVAEAFGLRVVPCRPALVPLTITGEGLSFFQGLRGVSLPARVSYGEQSFEEAMLFTHRGLSGPAILQISSYWRPGETIGVDLLPGQDLASSPDAYPQPKQQLSTYLAQWWPKRLAQQWCERYMPSRTVASFEHRAWDMLQEMLHHWKVLPAGTEGYRKAEVMAGGVDTHELSSKTMESRRLPGLFFVGEVVDVTGWLGGYNFQWAWASGAAAGGYV